MSSFFKCLLVDFFIELIVAIKLFLLILRFLFISFIFYFGGLFKSSKIRHYIKLLFFCVCVDYCDTAYHSIFFMSKKLFKSARRGVSS